MKDEFKATEFAIRHLCVKFVLCPDLFILSLRKPGSIKKRLPRVGSLLANCVGVPRFELGTSRTRTVRSTGLSHTPITQSLLGKRANYTIAT